jgi:hypothetical protein
MSGVNETEDAEDADAGAETPGLDGLDEQLINQLVDRAKAGGLQLTGEGGALQQLTKRCWSPLWWASSAITWAVTSMTRPQQRRPGTLLPGDAIQGCVWGGRGLTRSTKDEAEPLFDPRPLQGVFMVIEVSRRSIGNGLPIQ